MIDVRWCILHHVFWEEAGRMILRLILSYAFVTKALKQWFLNSTLSGKTGLWHLQHLLFCRAQREVCGAELIFEPLLAPTFSMHIGFLKNSDCQSLLLIDEFRPFSFSMISLCWFYSFNIMFIFVYFSLLCECFFFLYFCWYDDVSVNYTLSLYNLEGGLHFLD